LVAGIIRRHRKKAGSRWRKLNPGQQALLVLAYLRKGETSTELTAGFGVGTTTAWRYVNETVALLAAVEPGQPGPQVLPVGRADLAAAHLPGDGAGVVEGDLSCFRVSW
jgi:hypothetical protein